MTKPCDYCVHQEYYTHCVKCITYFKRASDFENHNCVDKKSCRVEEEIYPQLVKIKIWILLHDAEVRGVFASKRKAEAVLAMFVNELDLCVREYEVFE